MYGYKEDCDDCRCYRYVSNWSSNRYYDQNTNARHLVNRCLCVKDRYFNYI